MLTLPRSVSANYFFLGWIGDMLYMDKTFDEAMEKRGFANTSVRNEQGRYITIQMY